MATPREYLQGILTHCGVLQEATDEQLARVHNELREAEDLLDDASTYIDSEDEEES